MPTITLYSKPNCPLCDQARHLLTRLQAETGGAPWTVDEVNILDDAALYKEYRYRIPVVEVAGGVTLVAPLSLNPDLLRRALALGSDPALATTAQQGLAEAADERARMEQEERVTPSPPSRTPQATPSAPITDYAASLPTPLRILFAGINGLAHNLLGVLTVVLGVWVTLPWLAPIFAKLGWWGPADLIYTVYIFFCHQLPERAGNLFGYQVAWCYRNTALYTSVFLVGLLYVGLGQKGRGPRLLREGITWQVGLLCTIPIMVDGLSHMLGLRVDNAWFDTLTGHAFSQFSVGDSLGPLNWWLRILTGGLFGAAAGLFGFPLLGRTLRAEATRWGDEYSAPPPVAAQPA